MKKLIGKSIEKKRQGGYLKEGPKRVPGSLHIVDINNFVHDLDQSAPIDEILDNFSVVEGVFS